MGLPQQPFPAVDDNIRPDEVVGTRGNWEFSKAGIAWDEVNQLSLITMDASLTASERKRIQHYRELWNHYEGYHWEGIPLEDGKPQVTLNYCRRFVDKFTSFLFGLYDVKNAGFTLKVPVEMEAVTLPFLNSVWDAGYNDRKHICMRVGQSASVAGDSYVLVHYEKPGDTDFNDPFGEYPNGRIRLLALAPHTVFPIYDQTDRDRMISCIIKYPIARRQDVGVFGRFTRTIMGRPPEVLRHVIYRQVWYDDHWEEWEGDQKIDEDINILGTIPIVHIVNIPILTSFFGVSDLEDVIPLNKEINFKMSNNSEIIDYHTAPVTLVFGAKVKDIERGANKVWGNLPKDANVKNLELQSDLAASVNHIQELKTAMLEISAIPPPSLGAGQPISNTSGVALQIENMPLLEKIGAKQISYGRAFRQISRLILLMGVKYGLISIPTEIQGRGTSNAEENDIPETASNTAAANKDTSSIDTSSIITDLTVIKRLFYDVGVQFPSALPKDTLLELEQLNLEMSLQLESRAGALKRLGRENIQQIIVEIDRDADRDAEVQAKRMAKTMSIAPSSENEEVREITNVQRVKSPVVSGFMNGPKSKGRPRVNQY